MKKLLIGIFCLFSVAQVSYSEEVVKNSLEEEIVLLDDGRWMPKERVDEIRAFEEKVSIEAIKINTKRNRYRAVTVKITNNSRKELEYAAYGIKFKFGDDYSLRKIISVNNLPPGKSVEITRQISVQDIEGRDMTMDVIDFRFE